MSTHPTTSPGEIASEATEYVNPAEKLPRWLLTSQVMALRAGASAGFGMGNWVPPVPPSPTRTLWLDATLGKYPGSQKIQVHVFVPTTTATSKNPRPAVINFHGGGFILGAGTDDSRWAVAAMAELDAVVFSVDYRLAPSYPCPTPIEDCVDSIVQICGMASQFDIDLNRIYLSGFSAGGSLALSSWLILQDPARWGYHDLHKKLIATSSSPSTIKIAGISLFYPLLDWSEPRASKRLSCSRPDLTLPKNMTDLFDASYFYPSLNSAERKEPRVSPGLMEDELVDKLPPAFHLCLCEYDMLLAEGHRFAGRMLERGKPVTVRVVKGEQHGWDKVPSMTIKESVAEEYKFALETMRNETDTETQQTQT